MLSDLDCDQCSCYILSFFWKKWVLFLPFCGTWATKNHFTLTSSAVCSVLETNFYLFCLGRITLLLFWKQNNRDVPPLAKLYKSQVCMDFHEALQKNPDLLSLLSEQDINSMQWREADSQSCNKIKTTGFFFLKVGNVSSFQHLSVSSFSHLLNGNKANTYVSIHTGRRISFLW